MKFVSVRYSIVCDIGSLFHPTIPGSTFWGLPSSMQYFNLVSSVIAAASLLLSLILRRNESSEQLILQEAADQQRTQQRPSMRRTCLMSGDVLRSQGLSISTSIVAIGGTQNCSKPMPMHASRLLQPAAACAGEASCAAALSVQHSESAALLGLRPQ